jgi:hypothetical protein
MNRVADEVGFLVLYPQQSVSANIARCWNWYWPGNQRRGSGEPATIAALTQHVIRICNQTPPVFTSQAFRREDPPLRSSGLRIRHSLRRSASIPASHAEM